MKTEMLKYYQTIGKFTKIASSCDNIDLSLKECIGAFLETVQSDYVVVWFSDGESLKPYYWIGNRDFTNKSHKIGEGIVGKAFEYQTVFQALDKASIESFKNEISEDFDELDVNSFVCVPFSNKYETLGCIQFVRAENKEQFCNEDADICEILATIIGLHIEDNPNIIVDSKEKKSLLSVHNLHKSFPNGDTVTHVLKGVNMDIYEGELLVILGESGCGKSTFLNIVGGMETADDGEFSFMGKEMAKATKSELTKYRRENIGFIFQSYNLMPNLSAKENLDLIGELVKNPMDSEEALTLVGLIDKKNHYPAQLSGGQQQRISIARALVKKPKLIFADEPTAALDYATGIEVLSVLEKVVKSGATLVMVTHNEEITKMANRVVRMRNGKCYEITVNKHPLSATDLVW